MLHISFRQNRRFAELGWVDRRVWEPRTGISFDICRRTTPFLSAWAGTFTYYHSFAVSFMALQNVLSVVTDTAVFANKRPDIVVSSEVIHHVTLCPETKPAFLRTRKRTCIEMNEHMSLQVLFLWEGLVAVSYWALEGLSAKMHVHVSPIPVKPAKWLLALIAGVISNRLFLWVLLQSFNMVEVFRS